MRGSGLGVALVAAAMIAGAGTAKAACGGGKVVFSDTFDTLASTWGKTDEELFAEKGHMVMKPKANFTLWAPNTAAVYDNVDICAVVTTVKAVDANSSFVGLLFWYVDDKNFYTLEIDANGYASIWRRQNGRWLSQVDWVEPGSLKSGDKATNELRVVTKGKVATYYLNGKQFREGMGLPPDDGQQVGTIASSPKAGVATYQFDEFTVSEPQ